MEKEQKDWLIKLNKSIGLQQKLAVRQQKKNAILAKSSRDRARLSTARPRGRGRRGDR